MFDVVTFKIQLKENIDNKNIINYNIDICLK